MIEYQATDLKFYSLNELLNFFFFETFKDHLENFLLSNVILEYLNTLVNKLYNIMEDAKVYGWNTCSTGYK